MSRRIVATGQAFGKVDWVDSEKNEAGMFIRSSKRAPTRCILQGPIVATAIACKRIQVGMMVTASGLVSARMIPNTKSHAEMLIYVHHFVTEGAPRIRVQGAVYLNLKAVVLVWDKATLQLKSYLEQTPQEMLKYDWAPKVTVSVYMKNWVKSLSDISFNRFLAHVKIGREFTLTGSTEVSYYESRGQLIPVLQVAPAAFKLQS